MNIKYGPVLKWFCGGSLLSAIGLVGYVGNWWNNYNAEVEATISTQQIRTNGNRTITICVADKKEEIDWSEVQIAPTFYNPTGYKVENLRIQYEVIGSNIDFEPTDFFVKSRFSKTKDIYKYKDDELSGGEPVPSPFYSYTINGDYGNCDIICKESHENGDDFEYHTKIHFFVVENDVKVSNSEWMKECRSRMEKKIADKYCDVYFIDNSHHVKYNYAFALKSIKQYDGVDSLDVNSSYDAKSLAKNIDNIGSLDIIDNKILSKDNKKASQIINSRLTSRDSIYYIVYLKDEYYYWDSIRGNNTNILYYNKKIDNLWPAQTDTTLNNSVTIERIANGNVILQCNKDAVIQYKIGDSEIFTSLFSPGNRTLKINTKNDQEIRIYKMFRYQRSWWQRNEPILISIISFIAGLVFLFLLLKLIKDEFSVSYQRYLREIALNDCNHLVDENCEEYDQRVESVIQHEKGKIKNIITGIMIYLRFDCEKDIFYILLVMSLFLLFSFYLIVHYSYI